MLRIARVLVLVSATLATACSGGGDDSTGPESVPGTYTLTHVEGEPIPYLLTTTGRQIISATLIVNPDGTYRQTFGLGFQGNITQTRSVTGGYTLSGSTISMSFDRPDDDGIAMSVGKISGRTITGPSWRTASRVYTFRK